MNSLALQRFYLPGEAQFPLNSMYARPANRMDEGESLSPVYVTQVSVMVV